MFDVIERILNSFETHNISFKLKKLKQSKVKRSDVRTVVGNNSPQEVIAVGRRLMIFYLVMKPQLLEIAMKTFARLLRQ